MNKKEGYFKLCWAGNICSMIDNDLTISTKSIKTPKYSSMIKEQSWKKKNQPIEYVEQFLKKQEREDKARGKKTFHQGSGRD